MNLIDYINVLRRQWPLVLVLAVLGAVGAAASTLLTTPSYKASATLVIHVDSTATNPSQAYDGNLLSQQLAKSYTHLVKGTSMARDVAAQLSPPSSVASVQDAVSARAVDETNLVILSATASSPARAQEIASTLASVFTARVKQVQTLGSPAPAEATAVVIEPATEPSHAISPGPLRLAVIGGVLGLLIGFSLAVVRDRLARQLRASETYGTSRASAA